VNARSSPRRTAARVDARAERDAFSGKCEGRRSETSAQIRGRSSDAPGQRTFDAVRRSSARAAALDHGRALVVPLMTQNSGPTGSLMRAASHGLGALRPRRPCRPRVGGCPCHGGRAASHSGGRGPLCTLPAGQAALGPLLRADAPRRH
jgi:hypothetical protein